MATFVDIRRKTFMMLAGVSVALIATFAIVHTSWALHLNSFTAVDVIDHTFPAGGGSFSGTLLGGGDDGYSVFSGRAGDVVTIDHEGFDTGKGTLPDPFLVLFQENQNGCVEVGDQINLSNFNFNNQIGQGTDLIVLAQDDDGGANFTLNSRIANFVLPQTGQYAIGASAVDDGPAGTYTMTLSGNTLDTSCNPPVGGTTSFLSGGSGSSSGIALLAGAVAAFVALGATAWYTRRRWLGSCA